MPEPTLPPAHPDAGLLLGAHTDTSLTHMLFAPVWQPASRNFRRLLGLCLALTALLGATLGYTATMGIGVWGNNIPVAWGGRPPAAFAAQRQDPPAPARPDLRHHHPRLWPHARLRRAASTFRSLGRRRLCPCLASSQHARLTDVPAIERVRLLRTQPQAPRKDRP